MAAHLAEVRRAPEQKVRISEIALSADAIAGNRTRVPSLEGLDDNHYTTNA